MGNPAKRPAVGAILFFMLLGLSHTIAQTPAGESREVVSTGTGYVMAGDVAKARDDAIEDALRKGVEQVLGTLVESETLVENFQVIQDNIMTKTRGYVRNYQVISEARKSEALYEVTIRGEVAVSDIQSDLDAIATLMRRKNMPRVMVMIAERNIGAAPSGYDYVEADVSTAETAIMKTLMAKGFRFVDPSTVRARLDRQQAAAILSGDAAQAAAFGKMTGAEIVITGKAVAKATETTAFGATIRSQQATVAARAIRVDTGDIIATATDQGKFPHIDDVTGGVKAITQASEKVADALMTQILAQWQTDVTSGTTVTLQVQGVRDFTTLSNFRNALSYYVRGLESVSQRDYSEGMAVLEVVLKGDAESLARNLSGKNIEGMTCRVTGLTQNSVTVLLSTDGGAAQ